MENKQKKNVHDWHRDRLRDAINKAGVENVSQVQLLEFILTFSNARQNTNEVAHALLEHFGSLSKILEAKPCELQKVEKVGKATAITLSLLPSIFSEYMKDKLKDKGHIKINNPANAIDFFRSFLFCKPAEELYAVALNATNDVVGCEKISTGNSATVNANTYDFVGFVGKYNPVSIMVGHSHPDGNALPSPDDIEATSKIANLFSTMGIDFYDHVIIGLRSEFSFEQHKILSSFKEYVKELNSVLNFNNSERSNTLSNYVVTYLGKGVVESVDNTDYKKKFNAK